MTKFSTDPHKDPREGIVRLLGDDQKRNVRRRYGPQDGALVQCPKGHGFYPKSEECPDCLTWLEEIEARRSKAEVEAATARAYQPKARTRGQRMFERMINQYGSKLTWDGLVPSSQLIWERDACDYVSVYGTAKFDSTFP